jgi:SAM-dependent methyltransferase
LKEEKSWTTLSAEDPLRGINAQFLNEYSSQQAIRRYTRQTAGKGISDLLEKDYGAIYLDALRRAIAQSHAHNGVNVLEFGCGAGMNLLHLVSVMERNGIALRSAYGTDFSPKLIEAADRDAKTYLSRSREKVRFCVARNESLTKDLARALSVEPSALLGSFQFILGVNTFRYCHRLKRELECARAIFDLLGEGGICVMIDMNKGFPFFRSRFRDRLFKQRESYYLPSLDEYARPFSSVGCEILRKTNFCWIPHSAGPRLARILRALTPALDSVVPAHAMRSLVIAQKPHSATGLCLKH